MNMYFKSALNQIRAEDELVARTEKRLMAALENKQEPDYMKNRKRRESMKKLVTAACAAFVVIGAGSGAYAYYQTPVAYVSLDINPSVELGVNAFDTVVTAEGYNEDGECIMEGVDVIGNTVEEAVQNLVDSAAENGYIEEDGSTVISLTSETDDEELAEALTEDSETGAAAALEETGQVAAVEKDNVALARRDEARELEITPGKLNLINKLQALDPEATIEEYKDASVKEIMTAIYNCKSHGKSGNIKEVADTNAEVTEESDTAESEEAEVTDEAAVTEGTVETEALAAQDNSDDTDAVLEENANEKGNSGKEKSDTSSMKTEKNKEIKSENNTSGSNGKSNGKSGK